VQIKVLDAVTGVPIPYYKVWVYANGVLIPPSDTDINGILKIEDDRLYAG
jgi:hypothetical protein